MLIDGSWPQALMAVGASLLAGWVDAIVGGGGLVLVPALFAAYPAAAPATLLGTNKSASVWGTLVAARQYASRVQLPWATMLPAAGVALVGSWMGAWLVTQVDGSLLRRALPLVLVALLLYTLARKDLGRHHAPRWTGASERWVACGLAAVLGCYDGFFGPGTGSFLVFAFVRLLGYDFLHASAAAKVLNVATNAAALVLFAAKGHVMWALGLTMAVANVAGSLMGARLALRHGAGFVRGVFVFVVLAMALKTARDAYF